MRILIHSYSYLPAIGGIERTTDLLAREWRRRGHEVRILTQTPTAPVEHADTESEPEVFRRPPFWQQRRLASWADIVWQNHLSLRTLIPARLAKKPTWVTVQTWLGGQKEVESKRVRLKRRMLRRLHPVAISQAIRFHLNLPVPVILNPVDPRFFAIEKTCNDPLRLLFVGRLVPDKGLDVLLDAVARMQRDGDPVHLTIAGDGSESQRIAARIAYEQLPVEQVGAVDTPEVARLLAEHACLVVPSMWEEPLGIVALEGLAAGCRVVVSNSGGLGELVAYGAQAFPRGDVAQLVAAIRQPQTEKTRLRSKNQPFSLENVASEYERLFALSCST